MECSPVQEKTADLSLQALVGKAEELAATGATQEAFELYHSWIDTSPSPLKYAACFNLAVMYANAEKFERAMEMYDKSLSINPDFLLSRLNKGSLFEKMGKIDEALEQWRIALQSKELEKPDKTDLHLHALNNLGRVLGDTLQFKPAIEMLEASLAIDPTQKDVILNLNHLTQRICRWPMYDPPAKVKKEDLIEWTSPLTMLAVSDKPEEQLDSAVRFNRHKFKAPEAAPLAPPHGYNHEKIRIGYMSSNLSTHAVSFLTIELFEHHNRDLFEVYAFCWSHEDGTAFRHRVLKSFDKYVRIGKMSDKEAAECIRSHEIDILVDLQGLTAGTRPLILCYRPAPIQATYLGFPGTTGWPWIDYVIADRYLIPEKEARFYSEKPLYLENCFQSSDSRRIIGKTPARSDYQLPEDAFVFCSFNNNYKFKPEIFATWMRILQQVPGSVLWLLADNDWARENLIKFASEQGINKDRLIFTGRVLPEDYLARYQLADLFLDTYPFNGGTTANDALFMGLPLLTLSGRTFASRMAGSLLTSLGLPELITNNLPAYEQKAVELAHDREQLQKLKAKLIAAKGAGRVFNPQNFITDYEKAICGLIEKFRDEQAKLVPEDKPVIKPATDNQIPSLLVQGWRGINHSIAMVNQYQLLALTKEKDLKIFHQDVSFASHGWTDQKNSSGFSKAELDKVATYNGEPVSAVYRIATPYEIRPANVKTISFMVTELGLSQQNFSQPPQIREYEQGGNFVVTPSQWSRDRLTDFGFSAKNVFVIPHGVDQKKFFEFEEHARASARQNLAYKADDVVFVNVGAPLWNKGMDLLLKAFFYTRKKYSNARLLIKDQQALYGVSVQSMISNLAATGEISISDESLASIRIIPATISIEQLCSLYNIADYYLSPYRAEGFNMPVIEAIACGTPAIVTAGGSTDDFCDDLNSLKIPAIKRTNVVISGKKVSAYLEPDFASLVSIMEKCASGHSPVDQTRFNFGRCDMLQKFTWERAAKMIRSLL